MIVLQIHCTFPYKSKSRAGESRSRWAYQISDNRSVSDGVKQGGALSTLLFVV